MAQVTAESTSQLERFRLHEVAEGLYHFFWDEVCAWYLELVKGRLGEDADPASREAARSTLVAVLDGAFRLLHPIVPFVTSELWSRLPWPEGSERPDDLIVAPWPTDLDGWVDAEAERALGDFQNLVVEVRRIRKEYGIGEGQRIGIHLTGGSNGFAQAMAGQRPALEQLARVNSIEPSAGSGVGGNAILSNGAELFVPLEGVIDLDQERARLRSEIEKVGGVLNGAQKRLENEKFVANAPEEVVAKARENAAQLEQQKAKLEEKLAGLGA